MSTTVKAARVAFIGLGAMGQPMAQHLISAGFEVLGFDLSQDARQELAKAGGRAAETISDAMKGADYVITMLPNGKIVRGALLTGNACDGLKPGALVIDMSSSAPNDTRELGVELAARGFRLVDAPVSGGVKRAVSGTLTIMAGGVETDIEEAEPFLKAIGSQVFKTGPVGSGHAMKAINNFVSGAGVLAAIEAVVLGRSFGLEPNTIVDILNSSSGKNNATEVKMKQFILSETFGSGFALGLMAKDIRIAADLATTLGLRLEALASTADAWDAAQKELGPAEDHTRIIQYVTDHA
ncbi:MULTISPECIES: NAD(P)-dependent oxidoreductase [Sinorhizobium]|uniref:3-hydroxyisobutyrate dehydrogenase-related protein n=1 Tax=Rhizobium fredii TaxID=380 RepID=A0A2L0HCZ8_RHIFR|nr:MULTISPECIES: NAD(P)-dependent oxidoreductase [unclassified Sinorhizobium]AUX79380.1 3-hydroxyisobutyrate dehydrogenase-related protein [Sinorhizobium fredii]WEJ14096.1 NAD(P)-dependent oxidoreductase [Sinorhizobium sp. K101]WEJ35698.1 NAD(P)-dependent oxidoreductase [Sinorhizobium sp. C101]